MLDLQDRFINWLMNGFYESLQQDLERYGVLLSEALKKNTEPDIKLYLGMINETRGIINDMSDENLDIKDFVRLILGKYSIPEGDEEQ